MKLLSLLIVLLLWQFTPIKNYLLKTPALVLYVTSLEKLLARIKSLTEFSGFVILLVVATLILLIIDTALSDIGLLQLLFQCILLAAVLSALETVTFQRWSPENLPEVIEAPAFSQMPASLWRVNYAWVAPLFWYALTGVFGLIVYGLIAYLQQTNNEKWQAPARAWLESLAWLPARLLAFAYVVVGNFKEGGKVWSEYLAAGIQFNQYLLKRCAFAALQVKNQEDFMVAFTRLQRDALVFLLGIYAILAILGWII